MARIPDDICAPRFNETFTLAVREVMAFFECSNQTATHILWEKSFRMGTDRGFWIIPSHCQELIEAENAQATPEVTP